MPSKNVLKIDIPESYYHVYGRGSAKRDIFLDDTDYATFLNLIKRYLSASEAKTVTGEIYPNYHNKLKLLSYCLMPNHFHLLVYQEEEKAMTSFMRSLLTSYSRYFNKKYDLTGSLLESRFKAALISNDEYLQHISRYIHLNPKNWQKYPYSSWLLYTKGVEVDWLDIKAIMRFFDSRQEYLIFTQDYQANKKMLQALKYELANNITT